MKVLVVIPAYNAEKTINKTLDAILNQIYTDYKIVVVDDASTDSTKNILMSYYNKIQIITNQKNCGVSTSRNIALAAYAQNYEFIAFCDSDDIWNPQHLTDQLQFLKSTNADAVCSVPTASDGKNILYLYGGVDYTDITLSNLLQFNRIYISSVVMKTDVLNEVGVFNSKFNGIEDWHYWIRVVKAGFNFKMNTNKTITYLVKTDGLAGSVSKEKLESMLSSVKPQITSNELQTSKSKIRVIACCKNEVRMLPFFLQYYSKFVDQICIFDGGSDDGSLEVIKQYPKAVIMSSGNNAEMDERLLTSVRNEEYKKDRNNWDWQIIVDVDEFVYHPDILSKLQKYKEDGITIPKVIGYDMYSLVFPTYTDNNTIIDQIRTGKRNDQWQSKSIIFNPIVDINYEFGCHRSHPTGDVKFGPENDGFVLLHYNYVCYEHFIRRHKYNAARMSKFNKDHNLAFHISLFAQMTEEEFNSKVAEASNVFNDKIKIVYVIDHVYTDIQLDQMCFVHNKDWLSNHFDIFFVVRTLQPTYIKKRANFTIKAYNKDAPYEQLAADIKAFSPKILQLHGPFYLGDAARFVSDFSGTCKVIQQYGGGSPSAYWNTLVDKLIIDIGHESAFSHVPKDRVVLRSTCCELDIFKPMNIEKEYDCIMVGGFYASKGQDVVIDILKNESIKILFSGAQKSNMGEFTPEYLYTKSVYDDTNTILKADFVDFNPPSTMPETYNKAKIFLWGSRTCVENPITLTNRSVAEAVACGLPIVAFKNTFQNSNFVINGENAILVDTDEEYKFAVKLLLSNEELRIKMCNRSREIAKSTLDFKVWHDKFLFDLYNNMLSNKTSQEVIKVKPKFSIIIPTLNHLEDCLKPCCDSIIATTTLENVEVIVVGNGCTDGSKAYVESLGKPFKFLDFPNPLGYAKANNEGLAVAKGDYFILLNNDTVLLGQEKDTWINQLLDAFNKVQNCGISGPMRSFSYDANSTFLIFFCVCISRKCFESVGYLDESFKEGAGEDIAYCVEAIRKNFALVQVPNDEKLKYAEGYGSGGFPIWHKAEKTVHGLSNWSEIFSRNMAMLKNRYNS